MLFVDTWSGIENDTLWEETASYLLSPSYKVFICAYHYKSEFWFKDSLSVWNIGISRLYLLDTWVRKVSPFLFMAGLSSLNITLEGLFPENILFDVFNPLEDFSI